MDNPRIVVIGDSHTRALLKGYEDFRQRFPSTGQISIHWLQSEKAGLIRGDLSLTDAETILKSLAPNDLLVLSFMGTLHNIFGLLQHEQPFWVLDAISPDDNNVPAGHYLFPRSMLATLFEHHHTKNKKVPLLRHWTRARVYHLATPPPKADSFVEAKTKIYRDRAVSEAGITPQRIRGRMWSIEMECVSRVCKTLGIGFVAPPSPTIMSDYLLRSEYYEDDATHANATYGALVLEQLYLLAADTLIP